ncbi:MAG TPA: RelA/SpoT family protein [Gammaproteobacteria bacterium]|nr:RelA/SpoT family protein [Gammaproteobacteria bacterium]
MLEDYLEPDDVRFVYQAYLFGAEAHSGQNRASGEPYIYHPLNVARQLADMRMDRDTIAAAILHDVIEDTPVTRDEVATTFGEEVALLVDGVSKLTNLKFESREEAQAANFRKMMLAMSHDLRVILVKLADRLHNMHTLGALKPKKRRRIARETLEIYAPIAQRLGMRGIRRELERLGFLHLYPNRYRVLEERVRRIKGQRKEMVQKIVATIEQRLLEQDINCRVFGREKNLWSIYRKMRDKKISFSKVYDVFAVRVVVEDVDACYLTMGALHSLYKPVPGRFKDYIAIPKANGYQSLHTVLFGPHGLPIEVQIRTEAMDRIAETGIAAHWHYKEGDQNASAAQRRAHEWIKSMMRMQAETGNPLEFLEGVKVDLFPDEVYVFTPGGDIMALPRGATGVDFAYAVHTDIGNTCVAVKINRELTPLSTPLQNGNTVEVITAQNGHPRLAWLNYAVTAKARHGIRHFLKNLKEQDAIEQGRRLLDKELAVANLSLENVSAGSLDALVESLQYESADALFRDIGMGNRVASVVARELLPTAGKPANNNKHQPLVIQGAEGMVISYARCCSPIPGDPVIGLLSAGKGMVIHRSDCANVTRGKVASDRVVSVEWSDNPEGVFSANIRVLTKSQRGVLAGIANVIAGLQGDITNVSITDRDVMSTIINFTVDVTDRNHLAKIMRRMRTIPEVIRISRVTA